MNKKLLLLGIGLSVSTLTFAQKKKLNEANRAMNKVELAQAEQKMDKVTEEIKIAKEAIDLAINDPSTSGDAKTWITKAAVYLTLQELPEYEASNPAAEGISALKKAFELDPKLADKNESIPLLVRAGFHTFNEGVRAYNDNDFQASLTALNTTFEFFGEEEDSRFLLQPVVDTIRAQAMMIAAFDHLSLEQYEPAIVLFKKTIESPHLAEKNNLYLGLADAYERSGNTDAQLAILEEGKAKYPNDKNISNAELNYYLNSGKEKEMLAKLEEAVQQDPSNPELLFNLGIIYDGLANAEGEAAKAGRAEALKKAEAAYKKTLDLVSDNPRYFYQFGAFYFNQAAYLNQAMNDLDYNTEKSKYDELLQQRDALFEQSIPVLEKSRTLYKAKKGELSGAEINSYAQALDALKKIYTIQNKMDMLPEINSELDTL